MDLESLVEADLRTSFHLGNLLKSYVSLRANQVSGLFDYSPLQYDPPQVKGGVLVYASGSQRDETNNLRDSLVRLGKGEEWRDAYERGVVAETLHLYETVNKAITLAILDDQRKSRILPQLLRYRNRVVYDVLQSESLRRHNKP